jgi:hypothetical protein
MSSTNSLTLSTAACATKGWRYPKDASQNIFRE